MSRLDLISRTGIFPVRHHSPRSSHAVRAYLEALRPERVLVEGPSDADHLISVLVDPATEPPVALLGYRTDGTPASSVWPFATYSPEWAALRWASEAQVPAAFIDVPSGVALAAPPRTRARGTTESHRGIGDLAADARGLRSFEELWEADFEAPAHDPNTFRSAILAYAGRVRREEPEDFDRIRDAVMAEHVLGVIEAGVAPEKIAVILGAAHASAFLAGDVNLARRADAPEALPTAVTVIPYSFPRLAEQLGYGAGNRAPQYYQRAHDAGCSFRRATLEVLVELTEHLRMRGFAVSLADTIEAYRLSVTLADLRRKAEPGLDELREAAIATLGRGDAAQIDPLLWTCVIGRRVGKVSTRVGRSSLEEEFWREVRSRKLPEHDQAESFSLHLSNPVEVGTSVFLHRLRVSDVPYATFLGRDARARPEGPGEEAGGHAALRRLREVWEAQWTPATDVALVERVVFGESLMAVAEHALEKRLADAKSTGEAASVLLEAVVAGAPRAASSALSTCDALSVADDDLPSLAAAAHALSELASYGTSRTHAPIGDDAIVPLLSRSFERAVLRVEAASSGDHEAIQPVKQALRTLHEVARTQPRVDEALWYAAARGLSASWAVNAEAAGLASGLLYVSQRLDEAAVEALLVQRLSSPAEAERGADFLAGFLEVNALVLVKNRAVIAALDRFLTHLEASRFTDTLPVLRRAFSPLGQAERRHLLENVIALRGLKDEQRAARAILEEKDKESLRAMNQELADAMDALDDLL